MNNFIKLDQELLELQKAEIDVRLSAIKAGFTIEINDSSTELKQNENKELFELLEIMAPLVRRALAGFLFIITACSIVVRTIRKLLGKENNNE